MADNRQFGSPRVPHFGDLSAVDHASGHCAQCESMLADALDGTLSPADQALFDTHMATCGPCAQMLADARRGAAWLEMLRDPRPEPPAALLERILAQTSGAQTSGAQTFGVQTSSAALGERSAAAQTALPGTSLSPAPIFVSAPASSGSSYSNVLPFRSRFASAIRTSAMGQVMLQPRLAMTAAMAFFSIALTMDLTGVRLQDLRASSLRPESLKRNFSTANAKMVRYYEGLSFVYELESRVHDLQSSSDTDAPAGTQTGAQTGVQAAPGSGQPAAQPDAGDQKAVPQPAQQKRPAPNPGTSRREDLYQSHRLLASDSDSTRTLDPRLERTLA